MLPNTDATPIDALQPMMMTMAVIMSPSDTTTITPPAITDLRNDLINNTAIPCNMVPLPTLSTQMGTTTKMMAALFLLLHQHHPTCDKLQYLQMFDRYLTMLNDILTSLVELCQQCNQPIVQLITIHTATTTTHSQTTVTNAHGLSTPHQHHAPWLLISFHAFPQILPIMSHFQPINTPVLVTGHHECSTAGGSIIRYRHYRL